MKLATLLFVLVVSSLVQAATWTDTQTGIEWTYTVWSTGEISIGDGENAAIPTDTEGELSIPPSIKGRTVTGIARRAFLDCDRLETVTIPKSVTRVFSDSFAGCSALRKVEVPHWFVNEREYCCTEPDPAFYQVAFAGLPITDVVIAEGVESIDAAFTGCTSILRVTIPSSVRSIGRGSFFGCTGLGAGVVVVSGCAVRIDDDIPTGDVTIPSGTRLIEDYAYGADTWQQAPMIRSVTMSDGVAIIGAGAFHCCSNLTSIVLSPDVEVIGERAFQGCLALSSIDFPNGLVSLGWSAFGSCRNLSQITIPETVLRIGEGCFSGTRLMNEHEDGLVIVDGCLLGCKGECPVAVDVSAVRLFADGCFRDEEGLRSVKLPETMTRVFDSMFAGCTGLASVNIPPSVRDIGEYSFEGCRALSSIDLPQGVTNLGEFAFSECRALTVVTIPASVTSMGSAAVDASSLVVFEGAPPSGVEHAVSWGSVVRYDPSYGDLWLPIVSKLYEWSSVIALPYGAALPDGGPYYEPVGDLVWRFMVTNGAARVGGDSCDPDVPRQAISQLTGGEVVIPSFLGGCSVVDVAQESFAGCSNLVAVTIPESVTNIGALAFANCTSLTNVVVPNSVRSIALNNSYAPSPSFSGCKAIVSVTLPSRYSLRDVFPDSYDKIRVVIIADGSTTIDGCFSGCDALESVTVPASVTSIDDWAFYNRNKLASLIFLGDIPDFGEEVFWGTPRKMTLTVPENAIGWNDYEVMGLTPPWGLRSVTVGVGGGSGGGGSSSGGGTNPGTAVQTSVVVVSNVVVHYVMNSVSSPMAAPITMDVGIVNVMTEIKGGNVAIPDSWADNYPTFTQKFGSDFAAALTQPSGKTDAAGNPMLVWQDYVAGTDPTDEDDVFRASVTMVGGKPVVSYTPELSEAEKAKRIYTTYGKVSLTDGADWKPVAAGHESDYNFFKVTVEMK